MRKGNREGRRSIGARCMHVPRATAASSADRRATEQLHLLRQAKRTHMTPVRQQVDHESVAGLRGAGVTLLDERHAPFAAADAASVGMPLPMHERELYFERGGPMYGVMQRIGVVKGDDPSVGRRVFWFLVVTWVPLAVLAVT